MGRTSARFDRPYPHQRHQDHDPAAGVDIPDRSPGGRVAGDTIRVFRRGLKCTNSELNMKD